MYIYIYIYIYIYHEPDDVAGRQVRQVGEPTQGLCIYIYIYIYLTKNT